VTRLRELAKTLNEKVEAFGSQKTHPENEKLE